MNDNSFRLRLSTEAIAETKEAVKLIEQKERLEAAIKDRDAALSIDLSKAFLESIFKTIIADKSKKPELPHQFDKLYHKAKDNLVFSDNEYINKRLNNLADTIATVTGQLRNNFGVASHGKDGYQKNELKISEVEFVVSSVDGLAAFLYKRHRETLEPDNHHRVQYDDYPDFNDWYDGQYDGYSIKISELIRFEYTASQLLFMHDPEAYREVLLQYKAIEDEGDDDDD
ncbi:abortive infection family protein [Aeromonas sp. R2-2]|uniref:abortive infection family protein n=1 Tax=Aeromonas sp. R2-2 TaxID=3138460 RepID=UPI0034A1FC92